MLKHKCIVRPMEDIQKGVFNYLTNAVSLFLLVIVFLSANGPLIDATFLGHRMYIAQPLLGQKDPSLSQLPVHMSS